ncbi:UDP-glycosyltransferase 73B4-like [Triticum dicoccoides]|uniref:UDP-glycosyltransferase 73B4-like n=1 Tax=Triticum dicoccoides TaxID=85692 RepID=UPI00188ED30C|nr:UDP-glycosyltransferase 73B4-like [Triticum dicoccoides]
MAPTKDDEPPLHILFFPFLLPGHLIPMAEIAALFAARGVRCTVLTTPVQALTIRSVVDCANNSSAAGTPISITVRPRQWAKFQIAHDADRSSYGEIFNSFRELEPGYAEHYRATQLRRRVWLVGPVGLVSGSLEDVRSRGAVAGALSPDAAGCLRWLDANPASSVVYVSFGSMTSFSPEQMRELARGVDLSGKNFVWVIANDGAAVSSDPCKPGGFPTTNRGYIVRGWAPQVLILNHPAIGGFVTHCVWNSTLEAVNAGVPMVTWPRYVDQFYNEKLVVEVLGVGVGDGAEEYASSVETHRVIAGEAIAESIRRLMEGEGDGAAMRKKAKELGVMARGAVEKGGSSYDDAGQFMEELIARRSSVGCTADG